MIGSIIGNMTRSKLNEAIRRLRHAKTDFTHIEAQAAATDLPKRLWETILCSNTMEPPVRAHIEIHEFNEKTLVAAKIPEMTPAGKPCYRRDEILALLRERGDLSRGDTSQTLSLSEPATRKWLAILREERKIGLIPGTKAQSRYVRYKGV